MEEKRKQELQQSQQGSGSSENTGKDRQDQKAGNLSIDEGERENIAGQAGINKEDIADLEDLGMNSGRDDYAGGSGDDMSGTSTDEATDR